MLCLPAIIAASGEVQKIIVEYENFKKTKKLFVDCE